MFVRLDEVGFPHPTFCCRAVCHAEGAVSGNEAAKYYVDPGGDHRCEEFKQIIRRAKQQVVGDCESPRKALIAVAVEACGAGVVSDKPPSAFNLSSATIFSRGIGSFTSFGRAATSIARGMAASNQSFP
jgi:hypothetical protein